MKNKFKKGERKEVSELLAARDLVWEKRKKLSKNSLGAKIWASVVAGERMTTGDHSKRHSVTSVFVRTTLSRMWKRGYLLSPMIDKRGVIHVSPSMNAGQLYLVDILQKREYLIAFLRRHRKNSLLPSIKKVATTYEAAMEVFPETKEELLEGMNDDKRFFNNVYSTKLLK